MPENETSSPLQRYGGYAVLGIVVVAVAVLAVWYFASGGEDEGPAAFDPAAPEQFGTVGLETGVIGDQPPEVGEPAPDFALANARDPERVVRLSDFRGTPVVLNWYASWCGPCRREIPDFQKAYAALDGEVVFLGVNLQGGCGASPGAAGSLCGELPGSTRYRRRRRRALPAARHADHVLYRRRRNRPCLWCGAHHRGSARRGAGQDRRHLHTGVAATGLPPAGRCRRRSTPAPRPSRSPCAGGPSPPAPARPASRASRPPRRWCR